MKLATLTHEVAVSGDGDSLVGGPCMAVVAVVIYVAA